MATHGRGLICMPVEGDRLDELAINRMVPAHGDHAETNFAVSIDLEVPGSTGISAFDRARTIQHVLEPDAQPEDFRRPGHVFPLRYVDGGVLRRPGSHRGIRGPGPAGGKAPAGVICEIMNADGTMARLDDLVEFCGEHGLLLVTIADLIAYRRRTETIVATCRRRSPADALRNCGGCWATATRLDGTEHVAVLYGDVENHPGRSGADALGVPHGRRVPLRSV
jgi:3,4-dihydroxy 2-butanone 4-phosphate synthase / GTP cyclohydrolase II